MCNLNKFCFGLLVGSTILYGLFISLTKYTQEQICEGSWGKETCPSTTKRTGFGKCTFEWKLFVALKETPVLHWESFYNGHWKEGKKNGKGHFVSLSGYSYDGEWKDDLREGKGVFTLVDGATYKGTWTLDRFTGSENELMLSLQNSNKYPDSSHLLIGTTFVGRVTGGLMDGLGVITFGNSDEEHKIKLNGKFKEGGLVGNAVITLKDGTTVQITDFSDNWSPYGSYSASGVITVQSQESVSDNNNKEETFKWNGEVLSSNLQNGVVVSSASRDGSNNSTIQQVYEVLNALKWFEFHWVYSKGFLEAEIFPFDCSQKAQQDENDLSKEKVFEKMQEIEQQMQQKVEL